MGVQTEEAIHLTIACAFIGRHIPSLEAYFEKKAQVIEAVELVGSHAAGTEVRAVLNAADSHENRSVYLTVSGTSAESGDDGQVGRGNRVSGLITPCRPMSLEAAAGKNPVTHTGKIYQIAAQLIARALVSGIEGVARAECLLVSEIGRPISQPKETAIRLEAKGNEDAIRRQAHQIVQEELSRLPHLWKECLSGAIKVI